MNKIFYLFIMFIICPNAKALEAVINWVHDGSNVDQFIIYASKPGETQSTKEATVSGEVRSYETNVECGTSFFIFACNKKECSEPSMVVNLACPAPTVPILSIH